VDAEGHLAVLPPEVLHAGGERHGWRRAGEAGGLGGGLSRFCGGGGGGGATG
jgi:hypothetical protein